MHRFVRRQRRLGHEPHDLGVGDLQPPDAGRRDHRIVGGPDPGDIEVNQVIKS